MTQDVVRRPDPIRLGQNPFADDTMAVRVPGIIREVQAMNPDYPASIMRRLDQLHAALVNDEPIAMLDLLPAPEPGYADWLADYQAQRQRYDPFTWRGVDWFFAETFCYRHLIQAVRWFETGRDPFALKKQEELQGERLPRLVNAALEVEGDFGARLAALLAFDLWGNRVDLSHPAGLLSSDVAADDLLADDRARLLRTLLPERASGGPGLRGGRVHLIADNAGTELAMDLALIDLLITVGDATVVLHVKPHPAFVSDAIAADVWRVIGVLEAYGGAPADLAQRLRAAWSAERFKIATDFFWMSSRFLWQMPPTLHRLFAQADLVILKGDLNYRRAVGDALWDPTTPLATAVHYFPAPLIALRSLKCDVVLGVPGDVVRRLDAANPHWRPSGQHGVIQFAAPGL